MTPIDDTWIDVSFTVKLSSLKGGKLMRNPATGEEVLVGGPLPLDLDIPEAPVELLKKPRARKVSK